MTARAPREGTATAIAPEAPEAPQQPFERVVALLRARGVVQVQSADQVRACCPAHPDQRPSLSVKRVERGVVFYCFARCPTGRIAQALGLRMADLFHGPRPSRARQEIVAVYDYPDSSGLVIARKKRTASKRFWWGRPDPTAPGGWRGGLGDGGLPGLYRRPELAGAVQVFVVEGEKAADRLGSLGLVATCGPAGASTWKTPWSVDLLAAAPTAEVVILPDRDFAGERHAARVVADLAGAAKGAAVRTLKVLALPALPPGGDVVDWLEAGHGLEELLELVAATPPWSPQAVAQRRAERKRAQAKRRMQQHRARRRVGDGPTPPATMDGEATALAAVLALLASSPGPSGRAIKAALAGTVARAAVERALHHGVRSGALVADPTGLRRAITYRVGADIRSVTVDGTVLSQCPAVAHSPQVPARPISTEETSVSRVAVTRDAVTHRVRTSVPLQKTVSTKDSYTRVTDGGTLVHTCVTGTGTLKAAAPLPDDQPDLEAVAPATDWGEFAEEVANDAADA